MDVYQRRRLVALSAIAAFFIVVVLLIRGCGGDDEEPAAPLATGASGLEGATTQSQNAYIDAGDAICLEANTVIANIDEASETAVAEEASAVQSELGSLQSLPAPDDGQDALDAFLAALAEHADTLERQTVAIEREDAGAAEELALEADEQAADIAKTARRFGFEVCGNPDEVGESSTTGEQTTGETGTETTEPVVPTETVPVEPTTPPVDTGTEGGVGTEPTTPPDDTGGDTSSGGVSP